MNEAIYRLTAKGGSVRIVVQKKPDGSFILGVSNGKHRPLICQGTPDGINREFDGSIETYITEIEKAEIETKLNAATETQNESENPIHSPVVPIATPAPQPVPGNENHNQPEFELDFGF